MIIMYPIREESAPPSLSVTSPKAERVKVHKSRNIPLKVIASFSLDPWYSYKNIGKN